MLAFALALALALVLLQGTTDGSSSMTAASGAYVYTTFHHGVQCATKTYEYSIDNSIKLNTCLPSDIGNAATDGVVSTWLQTDAPHKFSCSMGQRKYTVTKTTYGASDATCSLAPAATAQSAHEFVCKKDPLTGAYKLSHCGNLPDSLGRADQITVKVYTNERCTTESKTRGYLMGQCSAMYDPQTLAPLTTYSKLAFALTYTSTDAAGKNDGRTWARGVQVWALEQQVFENPTCAGAPVRTIKVEYGSSANCKQDKLHPNFYYTFAAHVGDPNAPAGSGGGGGGPAVALSSLAWVSTP